VIAGMKESMFSALVRGKKVLALCRDNILYRPTG
jgi:hypothetical protein